MLMNRREYLNNLMIKSNEELIGRTITFVDTNHDLILYFDNGKILFTSIENDGWDDNVVIETKLNKLLGIINFNTKSKLYLEKYSNFKMVEYRKLLN